VFATRRLIAWFVTPAATLIAGPLADYVFEPGMNQPSNLSDTFSWLVGTGSGAGMALLVILSGIGMAIVGLGGYVFRPVRDAERILPDHEIAAAPASD
jgi:hypothetical protein